MAARPIERMKTSRVEEVVGETDAVAEERALRERARRVDGDDADARPSPSRTSRTSALDRLDLPTPGGPVTPIAYARPVSG